MYLINNVKSRSDKQVTGTIYNKIIQGHIKNKGGKNFVSR